MKKDLLKWMTFFMLAIVNVGFVSCGDDDDSIDNGNENSPSSSYNSTAEKLKGTSWKWVRNDWYRNGSIFMSNNGDNSVITFSEENASASSFYMYVNGNNAGFWFPNTEGTGVIVLWNSTDDNTKYGSMGKIYKLTSSELVTGTDVKWHYFVKVSYNGGGGGSSSGYAPSFRDFSYTYTSNSITVQFLTEGNNTTNATVYYGKSTSPSTSVSTSVSGGHIISARITGLTKATKYYVKCVATNNYGSTTSNVLPVMTGSN